MIDVNVHVSRWPFRRLPDDETPRLLARLRAKKFTQAWAGSFDALLHRDMQGVNLRLMEECEKAGGMLVPFGSVNPTLPDWPEDLRRCHEDFLMPGIRLYPNYHGYTLGDAGCEELLDAAAGRGMIVQIAMRMEDDRTHHPLMMVPDVDPAPLAGLVKARPDLKLVILNGARAFRPDRLAELMTLGQVYFDTSTIETVGALERLINVVPVERVLLGSHFPFFYLDATTLKLKESELAAFQQRAVTHDNAARLLASVGTQ